MRATKIIEPLFLPLETVADALKLIADTFEFRESPVFGCRRLRPPGVLLYSVHVGRGLPVRESIAPGSAPHRGRALCFVTPRLTVPAHGQA